MSIIAESLDGQRIGYKGNVYVAVPEGMTPDDALSRLLPGPPLADDVRAAVERLGEGLTRAENDLKYGPHTRILAHMSDLRTILTHLEQHDG